MSGAARIFASLVVAAGFGLPGDGLANTIPFGTSQTSQFLLIGNGPVNDSSGAFSSKGVGNAVDLSNAQLGSSGDGNVAITHPDGTYASSNVDLDASLGVQCASAGAGCDGTADFSGLLDELFGPSGAHGIIPGLSQTATLDVSGNGGKITSDETFQLAPGLNVIDIVTGGGDFSLENADLVIEGSADSVAIFRIPDHANFKVSQGNIGVGDGGIGLHSVLFFSGRNDNGKHFDFSNTVLDGVAFYDLGAQGSEISVSNGQGCTQFVGDKIGLQNVAFSNCSFGVPEPAAGSLVGAGLATLLLLGAACKR